MTSPDAPVGWLRTFFGPSRTRTETVLGAAGGALMIVLLVAYIQRVGGWQEWTALQFAVLALTGGDLIGGISTISASTANRWYHRPGPAAQRFRFGFVAAHALFYLVPVAAVFDLGLGWVLANAGFLVLAAIVIEHAPAEAKRMVALYLTLAASLANLTWLPIPAALAWLPVLLFVKILVCFLIPDAAAARQPAAVDSALTATFTGRPAHPD